MFNIVPGFPLDGGRVLRSIAFILIGWGIVNVLSGNLFGGLWIAFIGWFLNNGAEATRQQLVVHTVPDGVPVTSVMDASPEVASPDLLVGDFMLEHALRRGQRALPVVDGGRLVGIVSITDAKHLGQDTGSKTPVSNVMTRMPLKILCPDADLTAALQLMAENGLHQLPVVHDGVVVGWSAAPTLCDICTPVPNCRCAVG